METLICQGCGFIIRGKAKFCSGCGTQVTQYSPTALPSVGRSSAPLMVAVAPDSLMLERALAQRELNQIKDGNGDSAEFHNRQSQSTSPANPNSSNQPQVPQSPAAPASKLGSALGSAASSKPRSQGAPVNDLLGSLKTAANQASGPVPAIQAPHDSVPGKVDPPVPPGVAAATPLQIESVPTGGLLAAPTGNAVPPTPAAPGVPIAQAPAAPAGIPVGQTPTAPAGVLSGQTLASTGGGADRHPASPVSSFLGSLASAVSPDTSNQPGNVNPPAAQAPFEQSSAGISPISPGVAAATPQQLESVPTGGLLAAPTGNAVPPTPAAPAGVPIAQAPAAPAGVPIAQAPAAPAGIPVGQTPVAPDSIMPTPVASQGAVSLPPQAPVAPVPAVNQSASAGSPGSDFFSLPAATNSGFSPVESSKLAVPPSGGTASLSQATPPPESTGTIPVSIHSGSQTQAPPPASPVSSFLSNLAAVGNAESPITNPSAEPGLFPTSPGGNAEISAAETLPQAQAEVEKGGVALLTQPEQATDNSVDTPGAAAEDSTAKPVQPAASDFDFFAAHPPTAGPAAAILPPEPAVITPPAEPAASKSPSEASSPPASSADFFSDSPVAAASKSSVDDFFGKLEAAVPAALSAEPGSEAAIVADNSFQAAPAGSPQAPPPPPSEGTVPVPPTSAQPVSAANPSDFFSPAVQPVDSSHSGFHISTGQSTDNSLTGIPGPVDRFADSSLPGLSSPAGQSAAGTLPGFPSPAGQSAAGALPGFPSPAGQSAAGTLPGFPGHAIDSATTASGVKVDETGFPDLSVNRGKPKESTKAQADTGLRARQITDEEVVEEKKEATSPLQTVLQHLEGEIEIAGRSFPKKYAAIAAVLAVLIGFQLLGSAGKLFSGSKAPEAIPQIQGRWAFAYRFKGRDIQGEMFLKQSGTNIGGEGQDGQYFVIKGIYKPPRIDFEKQYVDTVNQTYIGKPVVYSGDVNVSGNSNPTISGTYEAQIKKGVFYNASFKPVTGQWEAKLTNQSTDVGAPGAVVAESARKDPGAFQRTMLLIALGFLAVGLGIAGLSVKFFGPSGLLIVWEKRKYIPSQYMSQHKKMLGEVSKPKRAGGLPLGIRAEWDILSFWEPKELALTPEMREQNPHMLIVGGMQKGKTRYIASLITNDIETKDRAVVAIDSNGVLVDLIIRWIAAHPRGKAIAKRVIIIDPNHKGDCPSYNPLELPADGDLQSAASSIVNGFKAIYREPPGSQSQWNQQTANILRSAALLLMVNDKTLVDLPTLLSDNDFRDILLEKVEKRKSERVEFITLLETWAQYKRLARTDQWINWVEPILNRVSPMLSDPRIRPILTSPKGNLSLVDLITEKKILLVKIPSDQNANLLGSLLVTGIKQASLSVKTGGSNTHPTTLCLDEFDNFIEKETIESLTSETRKYQIGLVASIKTFQHLPEDFRNHLTINMGTLCTFALAKKDADMVGPQMFRVDGRKLKHQRLSDIFNRVNAAPSFEQIGDEEKLNIDRLVGQDSKSFFCYRVGSVAGVFKLKSHEFDNIADKDMDWSTVDSMYAVNGQADA